MFQLLDMLLLSKLLLLLIVTLSFLSAIEAVVVDDDDGIYCGGPRNESNERVRRARLAVL